MYGAILVAEETLDRLQREAMVDGSLHPPIRMLNRIYRHARRTRHALVAQVLPARCLTEPAPSQQRELGGLVRRARLRRLVPVAPRADAVVAITPRADAAVATVPPTAASLVAGPRDRPRGGPDARSGAGRKAQASAAGHHSTGPGRRWRAPGACRNSRGHRCNRSRCRARRSIEAAAGRRRWTV